MGNRGSCCWWGGGGADGGLQHGGAGSGPQGLCNAAAPPPPATELSASNLQHISEREPSAGDPDPSQHPCAATIFMERSRAAPRRKDAPEPKLKKSSSCSTIYLDDSTVSQPNLKNTVKCVALAVYYHIKNRTSQRQLDIFDERLHPLTRGKVPDDYDRYDPEHKQIYKFVRTLFNAAQLTAECAIITLVYLERLLICADVDIAPSNWKRIVLAAILLASKVWDDQAVWNVDYCQILKEMTIDDMNELERQFLEMLQFNINVPSSVYAKYYFDLRTLAESNNLSFPGEPLSKDRAQKLEAMSRVMEDKLSAELKNGIKKWSSMDNVNQQGGARRSVAILS